MYALVDCNNFFVSCERVFDPSLLKKPVAVLSSNDGCIIARSQEVKDLGIPMGSSVYEYQHLLFKHNVVLFSSNFALYADMSNRVTHTLRSFGLPVEKYSIDESFLSCDHTIDARKIRERVLRWTGIPTAIGIAPTKTLAKIANKIAKKGDGTFSLLDEKHIDQALATFPVGDIWGIGRKHTKKLLSYTIKTALDLKRADDTFIRKHFSVFTLKTMLELRGISCLHLEEVANPKQSMTCSRSFGKPVIFLDELKEAVATFTAQIAQKLRKEKQLARLLIVYTPHGSMQTLMPYHTSDTRVLLNYAISMTEELFSNGIVYKKAGIIVADLCGENIVQGDIFSKPRDPKLMNLLDAANARFGKGSLYFAVEGKEKKWKSKQEKISRQFTTSWNDLIRVR